MKPRIIACITTLCGIVLGSSHLGTGTGLTWPTSSYLVALFVVGFAIAIAPPMVLWKGSSD
jgi:hypothetical protein